MNTAEIIKVFRFKKQYSNKLRWSTSSSLVVIGYEVTYINFAKLASNTTDKDSKNEKGNIEFKRYSIIFDASVVT